MATVNCGRVTGTTAGTQRVKDINPTASASPQSLTAVGSTLYFFATSNVDGLALWKSDGTDAGTTQVKAIPSNADSIQYVTNNDTFLYFVIRSL